MRIETTCIVKKKLIPNFFKNKLLNLMDFIYYFYIFYTFYIIFQKKSKN